MSIDESKQPETTTSDVDNSLRAHDNIHILLYTSYRELAVYVVMMNMYYNRMRACIPHSVVEPSFSGPNLIDFNYKIHVPFTFITMHTAQQLDCRTLHLCMVQLALAWRGNDDDLRSRCSVNIIVFTVCLAGAFEFHDWAPVIVHV